MVGIVVVSHSAKVAEGIRDLAMQMADKNLQIIAAGGMDDGSIGTDAVRIRDAILKADTGSGVVILVDLGSAVLSSNMAMELLEGELNSEVKIADAPILEGAVSAAIQASVGASLAEVIEVAESARGVFKL
ncbi:MAG: dihydroxyacetone kinase phosphoryl donor subunit DhaM [Clostridia bacterium]